MGHFTIKLQSSHFWGSGEEVARNTERRSSPTIDLVSEPDHPPPLHLRGGPSSDLVERLPASEPERLPAIREGAASSGSGDDPPAQGAESSGSGARPKTGAGREDAVRFWSDLKSRLPSSSQDLVEESAKKKKKPAAQVAEDEEKKDQRLVRFAAGKAAGTPSFAEKAAELKRIGEENLRKQQEELDARRTAEAQQLEDEETDPGPSRTIQGPYRTLHGPDWTL